MSYKNRLKKIDKRNEPLGLASYLKFGDYKNQRVEETILQDCNWFIHMIDCNAILLDDEAYEFLQKTKVGMDSTYSIEDFL